MKLLTYSMLLLGSWVVSNQSFAANNLEIIQELYNSGSSPAVAEDFPQRYFGARDYVGSPDNVCVVLDGTDQPYNFDISRTIRFTPSEGPLIPEDRVEKLVFGNSSVSYNLFAEPTIQGLDLVVSNPIYSTWVGGYDGVKHFIPATLFARKSCHYIAFKVVVDHSSQGVRDTVFYGYCYPKDGLPLF